MFFSNAVFITNSLPWNIVIVIALVAVAAVVGALVAHTHDVKNAESKVSQAEQTVRTMIEDAIKKAETIKKETIIEAREEALRLKTEQEREEKERRSELQRSERRLQQREESLDKKQDSLEQREQALAKRVKAAEAKEASIDALYEQQRAELERIAGMTPEEARKVVLSEAEVEARRDAAIMIRDIENKAKAEGDRRAVNIISMAIQRCASDHVAEATVSVVQLPNDEMKGRIIGREGRNIRTLETVTGVNLIINDTPEAVIL